MKSQQSLDINYLGKLPVHTVLLIADIACLVAHVSFLVIFAFLGITEMVCFNIFSVLFYAALIPLVYCFPKHYTKFICVAMLEVVAHAIAATICIGWWSGFSMFIVCVAPIPFFLDFKRGVLAYIFSPIYVVIFFALKIYTDNSSHIIYTVENTKAINGLFLFNSFISFMMIIGVAIIYRVSHEISQQTLTEQNEKLSKLATIDPLSQLFNRRAMSDYLEKIHEKSLQTNSSYVIAMGDIDDFKHINDTYGHAKGDEVIQEISRIMVNAVPSEGFVCRWGGEELLFAIPFSDEKSGAEIAEKIRSELESRSFSYDNGSFGVTMTFGVCRSDNESSYEKTISMADDSLYYGKKHGKNQVVRYSVYCKSNG